MDGKELNGTEPYTIEYNGSAEYLASGGYKNQTQLLTATLKPKSYPVKYYLEKDSGIELKDMTVTSHTWSKATALQDNSGCTDRNKRRGLNLPAAVQQYNEAGCPFSQAGV
jgi:hypothetical protein